MDMNPALLYRRPARSIFWIAFLSAVAIHIGAVALAKGKSSTGELQGFNRPADVGVDASEPEPPSQQEAATAASLEEFHPDQEVFREENFTPPPAGPHRRARPPSRVRGTPIASFRSVKAMAAYAPRPIYPYEPRRQRVTGSGIALLTVDQTSGAVTEAMMTQSCGNAILDNSTVAALRRWRFKPGIAINIQVPITYTLMGASY
jgi:TonB family protein